MFVIRSVCFHSILKQTKMLCGELCEELRNGKVIFNIVMQNKNFTLLSHFKQMIDRDCFIGMIGLLIIISSLSFLCFGN